MATNIRKVVLGTLLLVASSAIILGSGQIDGAIPEWAPAVAALGMAAGALFVGTSNDARPV